MIRGSTKKGGKQVIEKMNLIFNNDGIIAITNDGPKGPPQVAKLGSIKIAKKNNVQILTITGSATKFWKIKSWDNFVFPQPFGTIYIYVSDPININNLLSNSKNEVQILSDYINKGQKEADSLL